MKAIDFINKYIEEKKEYFKELAKEIWEYAEFSFEEYKSSQVLIQALEYQGFEIQTNVSDIPTAFIGKYGTSGYKFGFLGEFDALDMLSQEAGVTYKSPIPGQRTGHGCGHNLLGVGALVAAIATKEYLKKINLKAKYIILAVQEKKI